MRRVLQNKVQRGLRSYTGAAGDAGRLETADQALAGGWKISIECGAIYATGAGSGRRPLASAGPSTALDVRCHFARSPLIVGNSELKAGRLARAVAAMGGWNLQSGSNCRLPLRTSM